MMTNGKQSKIKVVFEQKATTPTWRMRENTAAIQVGQYKGARTHACTWNKTGNTLTN